MGPTRTIWAAAAAAALVVLVILAACRAFLGDGRRAAELMESFSEEVAQEAREDAAGPPVPQLTDGEFAAHAVKIGLYTKIYGAFVAELGEPAAGEAVAEVAEAYRTGGLTLDGLRQHIRAADPSHWKREAAGAGAPAGGAPAGGAPAGGVGGAGGSALARHASVIISSLGESLPVDGLRSVETALSRGFVTMRDIWEAVSEFKDDAPDGGEEEGFEDGSAPPPVSRVPSDPESFRRPDGTFDLAGFDKASGALGPVGPGVGPGVGQGPGPLGADRRAAKRSEFDDSVRAGAGEPADPFRKADGTFDTAAFNAGFRSELRPPRAPPPPGGPGPLGADRRAAKRSEFDRSLVDEAVRAGTGEPAESFRKADGTFDTAAFNASFRSKLQEGRAARAGASRAGASLAGASRAGAAPTPPRRGSEGLAVVGSRERDDGRAGRSAPVGSSAREFMRSVAAAESRAERREPYRVFPFPHAPPFLPTRFEDDNEQLGARVSAVYRTVFGSPPDDETMGFLTGRLREWNGDLRRLSNLVSTMHTIASAESERRREARDATVGGVVRGLAEGLEEEEAERRALEAQAEAEREASRGAEELARPGGSVGVAAVSEVAGVAASLMAEMERDGVPSPAAERGVTTALEDWRDAQIAIAEARSGAGGAPSARAPGLAALAASRQFEDPGVAL